MLGARCTRSTVIFRDGRTGTGEVPPVVVVVSAAVRCIVLDLNPRTQSAIAFICFRAQHAGSVRLPLVYVYGCIGCSGLNDVRHRYKDITDAGVYGTDPYEPVLVRDSV